MGNDSLQIIITAVDKATAPLRAIAGSFKDLGGVLKAGNAASYDLSGSLTATNASVETLRHTSERSFRSMAVTAAKVTAGVAAVGGAFSVTAGKAIALDDAMRNVDSIAKLTDESYAQLKRNVVDLSKTLPQSAEVLAQGLYDVYSSGFQGESAMEVLRQAAVGASAGLTTTATSARGLMAVMNAYNQKTGPDAQRIMDILFQTVNRGVVTFDELAVNIGDVTSTSAALGVNVEEVAAGLAVLTRHGITAAEATTALNSLMRSILNPSSEATKLAEELGVEWDANAIKAKGLNGVLADMIAKTKGNQEQMARLAGDARAIKAAFVLASEGGAEFTNELNYMREAAGATQGALERQMESVTMQTQLFKNNVDALSISIGELMLPTINKWLSGLNQVAAQLNYTHQRAQLTSEAVKRAVEAGIIKGPVPVDNTVKGPKEFLKDKLTPTSPTNIGNSVGQVFNLKRYFSHGGVVPGIGTGDTVPAFLSPGEEVLTPADPRHQNNAGGGVTIQFNGPVSVRSDDDIKKLAQAVSHQLYREHRRVAAGMPA